MEKINWIPDAELYAESFEKKKKKNSLKKIKYSRSSTNPENYRLLILSGFCRFPDTF